ncbi:thiopurine S-methyltransferase [Fistulifera solaris]|uniref:thiopurine S-methyltransferase n=1 Tax=Fistulifera solaris TaxID=1519565 RepID=A0A1Z5KGU7_FISSO|nr:thiopurine S-methyltransferase [Fistulifera solaris]|eukprot:GAX25436.1 thiopurine S-methyltransferase [Fistulifera solaris]
MQCYRTYRVLAPTAAAAAAFVLSKNTRSLRTQSEEVGALDSWKKRWDTGMTRWHQPDVYWALEKYGDDFIHKESRVLVPLCGKTVDLAYLTTKAKEVIGVEGVLQGVQEFMQENPNLQMEAVESKNGFDCFRGEKIWLLCGNFFHFGPVVAGKFDVVWDRAAMVAIKPSDREEYVQVLGSVLKPGGVLLLSGYIRPNSETTLGPPFTLNRDQVLHLFEHQPWIASVECIESVSDAFFNEAWYKRLILRWRFGGVVSEDIWVIRSKVQ